jgi:Galactose oxidase, central domain
MKSLLKLSLFTPVILISLGLAACSGVPNASVSGGGTGGGGGVGPYSIGGTVSGLAGGSVTLQNNGTETLIVSANGPFTFKIAIAATKPYLVTVTQAPTAPPQTCTVSAGSGTATATVTSVVVTCTTGTQAIGVTVAGLSGTGLTLQNGTEFLTITGVTTTSQFKTAIPYGQPYNVTVSTQPTTPAQTCTVTNGSGTSTAGVAINVQVTCSLGTLSIGGSVSGYSGGTGFALQDNGGDTLTITKNGVFTFPTLVPVNGAYKVTVSGQPAGPNQTCTVSLGAGTATANVTNVSVVCPAVFHPINVSVVGVLGASGSMQLQDNGGDNLMTPKNGNYVFATPIAHGSSYDVTEFVAPGTQPEGCIVWGFSGTALSTPVNPIPVVDCGHNDWTWMAGTNTADQFGSALAPTVPPAAPPTLPACPPPISFTPGGNNYSATWTDNSGNLWLLTGDSFVSTPPSPAISNLPGKFNELWVFTGTSNYFGSCNNLWTLVRPASPPGPTPAGRWGAITWTDPSTGNLWLFGGQDGSLAFLNDLWEYNIAGNSWTYHAGGANQPGVYGVQGVAAAGNLPGGRWGASGRRDPVSGTVWLFGGFGCDSTGPGCSNLLLNDLWVYSGGQWTWVSGAITGDQAGTYGTQGTAAAGNAPPGRQASVAWIDNNHNFWMFGGFTGGTNGFNDLWKFDPVAKEWTWMSGSIGAASTPGNYGTQGVAASTNVPGARWISAAWSDIHGNLWLFGGQGFDATGNGSLGDLWEYTIDTTTDPGNPATIALNQWTWIKGPDAVSQPGIYGLASTPTVWPHITNNPGTRWGAAYWTTTPAQTGDQEFWMLGGDGFDATGSTGSGFMLLNDLWRYLPYP